ncbi:concentrative nucleoside transporter, CNT family [Maridesulfovibrio ferrireducens]|uniref:Concentrative nucleoside transporter, CNT family n=1 Tax=Maridesulfovibrio ferrireducens TaxID=246191 RepID=A0A1G9LQD4_9BACT|nr:nucleoside transporter C-terminal domain-containing protein [Maridesulfovibrio ferrireducens]SDL64160.1 concentrative nucleoside transporter, CNT family [Maridesulfovibrio ferrireducens]
MIQSIFGLFGLMVIAWAVSENKRHIRFKSVAIGLLLQIAVATMMLKIPAFSNAMMSLNHAVEALQQATEAGTSFLFGYLGGGPLPFSEISPGASWTLAFRALPLILVVSSLSALLFYWRIIPIIVKAFCFILQKTMNIGGALGLGVAANIFVGMVEAPIIIGPYVKSMSRSELMTLMVSGMATISGTVLVLYASILNPVLPGAIGHILTASIISAPAAILIAQLMVPETTDTLAGNGVNITSSASSSMDAITKGASDGVKLLITVVALLLVLIALVSLANQILNFFPNIYGEPLTLQRILSFIMWPIVWLMGIPASEASTAAGLMGTKTVLNEFLAYLQLANLSPGLLSPRSTIIMTYAMCGFANLGSLGILIGGLTAIAPSRKEEIVEMGMKSIIGGTLATCMTGTIVGILY